jgi:hypothetical protein
MLKLDLQDGGRANGFILPAAAPVTGNERSSVSMAQIARRFHFCPAPHDNFTFWPGLVEPYRHWQSQSSRAADTEYERQGHRA